MEGINPTNNCRGLNKADLFSDKVLQGKRGQVLSYKAKLDDELMEQVKEKYPHLLEEPK